MNLSEFRKLRKPVRAKMQHHESKLQTECVKWFRLQYPQYYYNLFAIGNGGKRSKVEAAIMQGEGVVSGVADLMLAVPKFDKITGLGVTYTELMHHSLFIEMKSGKNKQTANQIAFQQAVELQGYKYVVCRTFEQFKTVITEYLK